MFFVLHVYSLLVQGVWNPPGLKEELRYLGVDVDVVTQLAGHSVLVPAMCAHAFSKGCVENISTVKRQAEMVSFQGPTAPVVVWF
jgi:hypothetical protein